VGMVGVLGAWEACLVCNHMPQFPWQYHARPIKVPETLIIKAPVPASQGRSDDGNLFRGLTHARFLAHRMATQG
jgi:hypothetical protein